MNDFRFLIDQLCNSMEFYTREEFTAIDCGLSPEALGLIHDEYWELNPFDRLDPFRDWEEWILDIAEKAQQVN